jgi:hypothetical protein
MKITVVKKGSSKKSICYCSEVIDEPPMADKK